MGQLFRVHIPGRTVALLLSEVLLAVACYAGASYLVLQEEWEVFLWLEWGFFRIGIAVASVLTGIYFVGLYDEIRISSRLLLLQQICLALGATFLVQAALQYLHLPLSLPRWAMLGGSLSILLLAPNWRILYSEFILKRLPAERLLFLGASPAVRELLPYLSQHPELGLASVGCVLPDSDVGQEEVPGPVLGPLSELKEVIASVKPNLVVIGLAERNRVLPTNELLELRFLGVRFEEVAVLYETVFKRVCIQELRPAQLIFQAVVGAQGRNPQWQTLSSRLIALAGIIVASPLMLLAAAAVRLSSPGPVLFRQTRVGWQEKPFTLYKFRSMHENAEADTGAVWAQRNDPRITGAGRWLRLLRLDELPQLFNVLKGEMVIVGPRPERPEFVRTLKEQIPFYSQRHSVRPGITGWAQINYKYGNSLEDAALKLEYDLYYIKHISARLDFYVLFHTIRTVLTGRGAH